MSGLLASGNIHVALLNDDGSFRGFLDLKNTTSLAINPGPGEEVRRQSNMNATRGQALNSVINPGIPTVKMVFDEQDSDCIAMALRGTVTTADVTSQTRTAVDLTVTVLDAWVELGDRFINTSGFKITENAAGPDLVLGTDYVVDYTMGLVKFLSTGSVVVNDVVEKTYTTRAITAKRITGGTKSQFRARILGNLKNQATGLTHVVNISECTLRPTGPWDPITGEFVSTELEGTIIGEYTVDDIATE